MVCIVDNGSMMKRYHNNSQVTVADYVWSLIFNSDYYDMYLLPYHDWLTIADTII